MKIVIVEDEVRTREGIVRLLNKQYAPDLFCKSDVSVIGEAACGADGIQLILEKKPDVVITDIRMEPMDGLQMLDILLNRHKLNFKTVILSAYSEFEYAKKAISLGVREYLIKPVDLSEFNAVMKRLEEELARDEKNLLGNSGLLDSLESIVHGVLSGQAEPDEKLTAFIEKTYAVKPSAGMALLCVYLGKNHGETRRPVSSALRPLLEKEWNPTPIYFPQDQLLLYVFWGGDFKLLEKFCQNTLVKKTYPPVQPVFTFALCNGMGELRRCFENLKAAPVWSIALGADRLISLKEIENLKTACPSYPIQIERDSAAYLCAGNRDQFEKQITTFLAYFSGTTYDPESIKKCVIRYFLAILQIVKEINFSAYEKINERETLEKIASAKTGAELEETLSGLCTAAASGEQKQNHSLLVQKVLRLVDEYYRDGITLKEAANELEVSPDYISAQLARELGLNFSAYIKEYRLKKAKELLIGTDLKLFEIASETGYTDAKYFGKVFKEAEGIQPLEYRKRFR
jgi:two-component system response regulator YesN